MRSIVLAAAVLLTVLPSATSPAVAAGPDDIRPVVDGVIRPLMTTYGIPGMAVGVTMDGTDRVFTYGVASRESGGAVTDRTLFEIGSLSKTFTATLAAEAQRRGVLSLSDTVGADLPALRGSAFDAVRLVNLGTHTAGGLPLQVPDDLADDRQLMSYFRSWKPRFAPGTTRVYSNPSIGLLGVVTTERMHGRFATLMRDDVFDPLGMHDTYYEVPVAEAKTYAQGYTSQGAPIRMAPGLLAAEAYGIRTTAGDMLRFLDANLRPSADDDSLMRAIADTHVGYFKVGDMVQALIWEEYATPVTLETLLTGNAPAMIREPRAVETVDPPRAPGPAVLIDKTGSTNGFGAYALVVPAARIGIVLLANRNYPIEGRVRAAYAILARLAPSAVADPSRPE